MIFFALPFPLKNSTRPWFFCRLTANWKRWRNQISEKINKTEFWFDYNSNYAASNSSTLLSIFVLVFLNVCVWVRLMRVHDILPLSIHCCVSKWACRMRAQRYSMRVLIWIMLAWNTTNADALVSDFIKFWNCIYKFAVDAFIYRA